MVSDMLGYDKFGWHVRYYNGQKYMVYRKSPRSKFFAYYDPAHVVYVERPIWDEPQWLGVELGYDAPVKSWIRRDYGKPKPLEYDEMPPF